MPETRDHRCYDRLFIGGHWRKPSTEQRLTVISPHSEEPIGEAPAATPADVDAAVAAARQAFDHGPWPRLDPQRAHAQGRRARDHLRRPPRRDGRPDHRRDGLAAQFQPAGPGRGGGVDDAPRAGGRPRLSLGRTPPRRARRSTPAPSPGRRGRRRSCRGTCRSS